MYDLINSNITQLLGTVNRSDVDPYIWMTRELHNRDVSQDQEFQREYCSYWALNGAGLGQPGGTAENSQAQRNRMDEFGSANGSRTRI